ncbi:MAG: tRNA (5-methylaminomethyl-2-thiouridine)(34)-methyltransferase MnmD [Crocinitomicaceae bacterium]
MQSKIIVTKDKSKTLLIPELNETYHSTNGALTEALHVFQKAGIDYSERKDLKIFEMGFGTGLNAILTFQKAQKENLNIYYECIEAYPVSLEQALEMDYLEAPELNPAFHKMHTANHKDLVELGNHFQFRKIISKIQDYSLEQNCFDLIFYDAFGPKVQQELWETFILSKFYEGLKPDGFLVTYCAQGAFKRNLKAIGFEVESIPGPPGKREMTRAFKR